MTSQAEDPKSVGNKMGIIEKYAIPYYFSMITIGGSMYILEKTHEPTYVMAYALLLPALGKFMPNDDYPIVNSKYHNRNIFHALPLAANVLATWALVAYVWFNYQVSKYTTGQTINLAIAIPYLITPSIDASHELIHRPETLFKVLGFVNMALFQFTVYPIQHLYLHHKFVGTTKDPITSPKNQNLYSYTIKAFFSAHIFTFKYSKKIFAVCMALNWGYLAMLFTHAFREYGDVDLALKKVGYFVIIGLVSFLFLEIVEYIEHYGLIFRDDAEKKVINEKSSWNSIFNPLQNWIIFRFQRHSDHHMNAYKIFTTLQLTESMPKFPFSFLEGIIMALCPPLWYYIMNPFVDAEIEGKKVSEKHKSITRIVSQSLLYISFVLISYSAISVSMI